MLWANFQAGWNGSVSETNARISYLAHGRYLEGELPRTTAGVSHRVAGRQHSLAAGLVRDALMVTLATPSNYYEIEFLP